MRKAQTTQPQGSCGTRGGYNRHAIRQERPCEACTQAAREWAAKWFADNAQRRQA